MINGKQINVLHIKLTFLKVVGAAEPELPSQSSPTPRGRRMTGVDSGDG
jgi:hypothetical protein